MNSIRIILSSLLLIFIASSVLAQGKEDKIMLAVRDSQLVIAHIISQGNTLFGISRQYNTDVEQIMAANNGLQIDALSTEDTIYIPIDASQVSPASPDTDSRPLYYTVQPKETLFRIARVYLKWREEQLMVLNKMTSTDLSIGQELFIGYIGDKTEDKVMVSTEEFEPEVDSISGKTMIEAFNLAFEEKKKKKKTVTHKGVAMWFEDTDVASGMFIMHHHAPLNSIIAITNPMYGKTVHAKVVGHIPTGTYPKEVIAVISPQVAKSLGALDKRFFTQIEYEVN